MKCFGKEEAMPKIIYCDNHLLIAEKPVLQITQGEKSLEEDVKHWLKKAFNKPGAVFAQPIHRLDKPASGIVVFARTTKALGRLQETFRAKQIKKTYLARVQRAPAAYRGTLEHFLVHDDFRARVVQKEEPGAKFAILHYEILKDSLLKIDLETGRYHQIRVQLAWIGSPICGDTKYGATLPSFTKGIDLHHAKIEIPHPTTGKILIFESAPIFQ
jgi:23S rRNA pseudouridine1911/1915/1917 synthase